MPLPAEIMTLLTSKPMKCAVHVEVDLTKKSCSLWSAMKPATVLLTALAILVIGIQQTLATVDPLTLLNSVPTICVVLAMVVKRDPSESELQLIQLQSCQRLSTTINQYMVAILALKQQLLDKMNRLSVAGIQISWKNERAGKATVSRAFYMQNKMLMKVSTT